MSHFLQQLMGIPVAPPPGQQLTLSGGFVWAFAFPAFPN
jgi:hypothetical protein